MRTTLSIDDDVLITVRYLAQQNKVALGTMISELIRKGLKKTVDIKQRDDLPVFSISENSTPITLEHVKLLEDEV